MEKCLAINNMKGRKVEMSSYASRAVIRYQYDQGRNILQKQCSKCESWFDVAYFENGIWKDCHDESEIHKTITILLVINILFLITHL